MTQVLVDKRREQSVQLGVVLECIDSEIGGSQNDK